MRSKRLKLFSLVFSFFFRPYFFIMSPVEGPYHSGLSKRRAVALRHRRNDSGPESLLYATGVTGIS